MKPLYALVKTWRTMLGTEEVSDVVVDFYRPALEGEGDEWLREGIANGYQVVPVTLSSGIVNAIQGIAVPWVDPAIVGALISEGGE